MEIPVTQIWDGLFFTCSVGGGGGQSSSSGSSIARYHVVKYWTALDLHVNLLSVCPHSEGRCARCSPVDGISIQL